MDISDLPPSLHADAVQLIERTDDEQTREAAISRLFSWLQNEGYDQLADYDADWVIADLSAVASECFSDHEMRAHKMSPLESDDSPIEDKQRVTFARALLGNYHESLGVSEEQFNDPNVNATLYGDENYRSIIPFELSDGVTTLYLSILATFGSPGGPDLGLHGLFECKERLKSSLSECGFVKAGPWLDGDGLDDETILSLWHYN